MAGVAVSMATRALGIEDGDEGALAEAIASGDPNVLVQLRQVDTQFKVELKRLGIRESELAVDDRKDARLLGRSRGLMAQMILSTIFVTAFSGLLYIVFGSETGIPEETREPALYLLGILSAGMTQIMNFWFGSSVGSRTKDNGLLDKL